MTMPGETVDAEETICCECKEVLKIGVYRSAAGYYIGFFCPNDGPYSRESGYYGSREEAEKDLEAGSFGRW
jgi:hypothetical protein